MKCRKVYCFFLLYYLSSPFTPLSFVLVCPSMLSQPASVATGVTRDRVSTSKRSSSLRSYASGSQRSKPRTQVSHWSTSSHSIVDGLTDLQAAMLEESVKHLELEEMKRQIVEDSNVEDEYQRLDSKARETLERKEEFLRDQERSRRQLDKEARVAHETRVALTKQIVMQRRLKEKQIELERASLITTFLKEQEDNLASSQPLSNCEYDLGLQIRSSGAHTSPDSMLQHINPREGGIPHHSTPQGIQSNIISSTNPSQPPPNQPADTSKP
ncbi:hypothetical protein JOB18_012395 [Solea senegalensis]|uniref:Uncharacterized protein n=1 Tax=Solea senegalensis TaxID=28829 RepID=A0AAV6R8J2_SOLSE|nr:hypothetical protein JOB18_012395 [Solea senegalensis]